MKTIEENLQEVVDNFLAGRRSLDGAIAVALQHQMSMQLQSAIAWKFALTKSPQSQVIFSSALAATFGIAVLLAIMGSPVGA